MIFGTLKTDQMAPLVLRAGTREAAHSFKLLGLTISDDLRWDQHIDTICSKTIKRLHYLNLLRRSLVPETEQLHYFKTIVRPVIEYAGPVWQSSLTGEQRERIETIQCRALKISSGSTDYELQCAVYDIEPVSTRLRNLIKSFF